MEGEFGLKRQMFKAGVRADENFFNSFCHPRAL
jgi:hypothetical protein